MSLQTRCELQLPAWIEAFIESRGEVLATPEHRMRLAVALARENVRHGTGGPFGAIVVCEDSNDLLGIGVNLVTSTGLSLAHAEMVALAIAQAASGHWNLGGDGHAQLVTSCEPCAMCFGAVPWSGVSSLVWGASKEDAEAAGFDEGDKPAAWPETLERRGIRTLGGVLREEAAAVLIQYARGDGDIYHPEKT
jgi:tRNA(Arg) A34 adenosine deaminase TadA